jgi:hypothetical protein
MSPGPKPTHTPPRQIRIDDRWYDFEAAAAAAGTTRAEAINEFIAWYTHRPGAKMPKRPDRDAWESPVAEPIEAEQTANPRRTTR